MPSDAFSIDYGRSFFIYGESMIAVRGRSDNDLLQGGKITTSLGVIEAGLPAQLGLASDAIKVRIETFKKELKTNATGENPVETQIKGAIATISMTLVHYDMNVVEQCWRESMGGTPQYGYLGWAGMPLGNGLPLFTPGGMNANHYISLNIRPARNDKPYRFPYCYLLAPPHEMPIGTKVCLMELTWRAVSYMVDPYNARNLGGIQVLGTYATTLFDRLMDGDTTAPTVPPDVT